MIELLTSPEAWAALLTLTALEIVLGIDNVIFLSVVVSRIPEPQATRARQIGLLLALVFRILLLSLLVWLIGLTEPIITIKNACEVGRSGCTVLFVSHSMPAIESLCTRVLLLDGGRVVKDGGVPELIQEYHRRVLQPAGGVSEALAERNGPGRLHRVYRSATLLSSCRKASQCQRRVRQRR